MTSNRQLLGDYAYEKSRLLCYRLGDGSGNLLSNKQLVIAIDKGIQYSLIRENFVN